MLQVGQQHWERRVRRETPLVVGTATLLLFFLFGNAWLADPTQMAERGVLFCAFSASSVTPMRWPSCWASRSARSFSPSR